MTFDEQTIAATVACENLIVRNLQVTLGYYRLSQRMRKVIGSKNVSWVGIATHASKTAGQAIRHELMPKRLKSAMIRAAGYDDTYFFFRDVLMEGEHSDEFANSGHVAEALKTVSLLVSQGNIIVYEELAQPFLHFTALFQNAWDRNDEVLEGFVAEHLRSGPVEAGGQDLLIEAFAAYHAARFETNTKAKAELVFQGNMLVGLHEQTRLQPFIEQALVVPIEAFGRSRSEGDHHESRLARQLAMKWGTRMLMSLTLPNRELRLGQDVVAPTGVFRFPQDLLALESPRVNELVQRFDRGNNTLSGTAADNWASLDQRMSFIVDLFRSHQQYARMFEAPFLDDQAAAIDAGHMPAGPL